MTYAEHAQAMAVLVPPERMGAATRALFDDFSTKGQQPCPLETGQVIHDFFRAVETDKLGRMPKKEADNG